MKIAWVFILFALITEGVVMAGVRSNLQGYATTSDMIMIGALILLVCGAIVMKLEELIDIQIKAKEEQK